MNDGRICLTLSDDLKEKTRKFAKSKGISINALIRLAIIEFIEKG